MAQIRLSGEKIAQIRQLLFLTHQLFHPECIVALKRASETNIKLLAHSCGNQWSFRYLGTTYCRASSAVEFSEDVVQMQVLSLSRFGYTYIQDKQGPMYIHTGISFSTKYKFVKIQCLLNLQNTHPNECISLVSSVHMFSLLSTELHDMTYLCQNYMETALMYVQNLKLCIKYVKVLM